MDLVAADAEGLHGDHVQNHAGALVVGVGVRLDVALDPALDEHREGGDQALLLIDHQPARPDAGDEVEDAGRDLLAAGHHRELGERAFGRRRRGRGRIAARRLVVDRLIALLVADAVVGEGGDAAVFAGEGVEVGVGRIGQELARGALRLRHVVDQRRAGRGQKLHRRGRDIRVKQLLDLGDHPALDLQAQGQEGRLTPELDHGLDGDLADGRIGDDDLERGQLHRPPPEAAFAEVQMGGVLGDGDHLGQRQRRFVLALQGLQIEVGDPGQAGAIAGLHVGGRPRLLVPGLFGLGLGGLRAYERTRQDADQADGQQLRSHPVLPSRSETLRPCLRPVSACGRRDGRARSEIGVRLLTESTALTGALAMVERRFKEYWEER